MMAPNRLVSTMPGCAASRRGDGSMRAVLPIMAVVGLFFLTIGMVLPVLPLQVHDALGFDTFMVGLVAGSQFVASLVSRIWAGRLADTKGPKHAIVLGLTASIAGGSLYLVSLPLVDRPLHAVIALLLGRTLLGAAESLIITSAIVWGLRRVPPERAGKVISWIGMAMFAAMAAGSPVGSWLFARSGFFGISVVATAVPLAALALVWTLTPAPAAQGPRPATRKVLGAVKWPGCAFALSGLTFGAVTSFLTLFFATRGWQHGALAFTVFAVALIAARIFFGHLPDRLGGARVAVPSLALQVLGLGLIGLASNGWMAMLGAALAGAGFSLVFPSLGLEAVARVPEQSRGLAMGTYNAFLDATLGIGGPALGLLAASQGLASVFLVTALAAALAMPIARRLQRNP